MPATADSPSGVNVTDAGGIRIAALDRPAKANAITPRMLRELRRALETAKADSSGVVICGAEGMFSGGIDLGSRDRELEGMSIQELLSQVIDAIQGCPVPVAALIDGPCIGGALEIAVSCDLRIGTSRARFGIPATSIGVVYRPDGYDVLLRNLGASTVRRLLLLGLQLDAPTGMAFGLLDAIDDDDPWSRMFDILGQLQQSPGTFAAQKQAYHAVTRSSGPTSSGLAEAGHIRSRHDIGQEER